MKSSDEPNIICCHIVLEKNLQKKIIEIPNELGLTNRENETIYNKINAGGVI